jgi:hypothetical protein
MRRPRGHLSAAAVARSTKLICPLSSFAGPPPFRRGTIFVLLLLIFVILVILYLIFSFPTFVHTTTCLTRWRWHDMRV